MKIRALFVLSLLAASVGCSKFNDPIVPPATVDAILEAAFVINGGDGQGVFVGNVDEQGEHVYLLTAKHVAIYFKNSTLDLKVGKNAQMTVKAESSRWRRAANMYDAAWFELEPGEREELRSKNSLKYIPLTSSPESNTKGTILGTGYSEFEKFCQVEKKRGNQHVDVWWSRYGELVNGKTYANKIDFCKIEGKYNVPAGNYWVVGVKSGVSGVRSESGYSGGLVLYPRQIKGREYWLLAGLHIGGYIEKRQNNCPYNLVTPIDVLLR